MDLRLQYTEAGRSDGVFGWVLPADAPPESEAQPLCVFVTHAYLQPDGVTYRPKVRAGTYECVRGQHALEKGSVRVEFETFEVTGVLGHKGILFHWGNWGENSHGCFCVGRRVIRTEEDRDKDGAPDEMVTESQASFTAFMAAQVGVERFQLIVEELYAT